MKNTNEAVVKALQQFEEDAKQPDKVIHSTLLKIITHNQNTRHGKKFDFINIKSVRDFKNNHPLTKYEDYEAEVERMVAGEENVLSSAPVSFFAISSGTTNIGNKKIIPNTSHQLSFPWPLVIEGATLNAFPAIAEKPKCEIMIVNANGSEYKNKKGIRIGMASTAKLPQIMNLKPYTFTSPPEVFNLTDLSSANYLHAFYAIKNPEALAITTTFVTTLLSFCQCIESNWQQFVRDIEQGTISKNELIISPEMKRNLLADLRPDPERAERLSNIFSKGFENVFSNIWPGLQYVSCLAGGTFAIYVDKCQRYLGEIPIYSRAHGASEGAIGINLWPGEHIARFVPIPQDKYTEYIPVDEINSANPKTLEINELKKGESYEVVITSFDGLCRYRLGDIVKVVDYYYRLPIYELEGRAGTLLDIDAERVTEEMSCKSIKEAVKDSNCNLIDYTTTVNLESSPPQYIFFVELKESAELSSESAFQLESLIAQKLDSHLKLLNHMYEASRSSHAVGRPQVSIVKQGTFRKITDYLVAKGASELQVKIPRNLRTEESMAILKRNRINDGLKN